ncbi:MAG: GNAT family N-acetyltransferase [Lachnospiraceae bacterium]|nr:GNAT family N-acetyltransferase [Ruminococcus sp.]MCM1274529.1 GNAT family N-acetyltransferase [Lachnospiraceae bacterium]
MNITVYSAENPMPRELFAQLFKIIEYSFPKNERRGFEEHFGEFQKPPFRSLVCAENGNIAGFMNYWQLTGFVYLEHFAVAEELRGKGLGAELMNRLYNIVNCPIILEAEPPELGKTAARRIEFYKRLGFHPNEYEYYQPPYGKNSEPVRLIIMSKPSPLSRERFAEVRAVIYRDAYETDFGFLS